MTVYEWDSLWCWSSVSTVTRGLVDPAGYLLSALSGLEPGNACQRGMWPGPTPVRAVLQRVGKGPFSEGGLWPLAYGSEECLNRAQASLCEGLQWDRSNTRTALSSPCMCTAVMQHGRHQPSGSHSEATR